MEITTSRQHQAVSHALMGTLQLLEHLVVPTVVPYPRPQMVVSTGWPVPEPRSVGSVIVTWAGREPTVSTMTVILDWLEARWDLFSYSQTSN